MPKPENSGRFVINKKVAQGSVNTGKFVADKGEKGNWQSIPQERVKSVCQ